MSQTNTCGAGERKAERSPEVYGRVDAECLREIDAVAEQMLMPRSWVVAQILREWAEQRWAEVADREQSWRGSCREGRGALEAV